VKAVVTKLKIIEIFQWLWRYVAWTFFVIKPRRTFMGRPGLHGSR